MPRTPTATMRIGDIHESGFVFRDKTNALSSPTSVSVEITDESGNVETITESDSRVTIGATLGDDLAEDLGLTTAENADGAGIVSVEVTPDIAGHWTVYCVGTGTVGADKDSFRVLGKTE